MLTIISYKMNTQTKLAITNTLITALEGGSNYWYMLEDEDIVVILDKSISYTENIINHILTDSDFSINISDCETEEHLGILNQESVLNGLKLARKQYKEEYDMIMSEDYDAGVADIIFQLMIMGEVIYG